MGTHLNAIEMSTHNICFYTEISKKKTKKHTHTHTQNIAIKYASFDESFADLFFLKCTLSMGRTIFYKFSEYKYFLINLSAHCGN